MMRSSQEQHQSRLFYDLCTLVLTIINSPQLPLTSRPPSPTTVQPRTSTTTTTATQVSPAGFASLLLGISLALMLCGSVTFVIGFILMPWVLGLVIVLYFVGIVSNLSMLGRAILCPCPPAVSSPSIEGGGRSLSPKQMSGEGFRSSVFGIFPIVPF
ncbi:hypothetical protein IFM89_029279 [Coptis chinensis]|uniref:Transmembrane protein n=1 Tax=Coptis chinensis TaxID=261450 RepID=A0A835HZ65_9MAGN|nr:hypothetical protein IFM89_029279 [Coptis chinensis]